MTEDAISFYHDLLTPDAAAEAWETLEAAMRVRRLAFAGRPICSVLRPYFLSPEEERRVRRASAGVLSALHRTFDALDAASYETVLGLSPDEAELARIAAGFEPVETIARLDGFLVRGERYEFVELNAESPGGIAFGRALADLFSELPVMQRFRERYDARSEPVVDHSLGALLAAYRAWGGREPAPSIAIVDWTEGPTRIEFELCSEAFRARGYPTAIADPTELEYAGGVLRAGEFAIDIVYRRLVASEIPAKLGLDHALVRAARDRAACIASGLGAFALSSKAMFALVSDPAATPGLTDEERWCVANHVPWTRTVREGRTTDWSGEDVDLVELAHAEREQLVVKPATEYGGSGVVLGWTVPPDSWELAIGAALERPHVLQRRVALPAEPFPVYGEGGVELVEFLTDVDPYCFHGRTDRGAGTRLSRSQLLNVTAGGGSAAPVFTVAKK